MHVIVIVTLLLLTLNGRSPLLFIDATCNGQRNIMNGHERLMVKNS
jgi:hypothetical protein